MDATCFDLEAEIANSDQGHSKSLDQLYKKFLAETVFSKKELLLQKISRNNQSLHYPDSVIYQQLAQFSLEHSFYELAELFCIRLLLCNPTRWWGLNQIRAIQCKLNPDLQSEAFSKKKLPLEILRKYFPRIDIRYVKSSPCEESGLVLHKAYTAETTSLTPPNYIKQDEEEIHEFRAYSHISLTSREAYTLEVPDGKIWFDGFNFVVWNMFGEIIDDVSTGNCEIVQILCSIQKPVQLEGSACLLGSRISSNYYHWMYDSFPKISVLEKSNIATASVDKFIVTSIDQNFQKESLAVVGIDLCKVYSVTREGNFVRAGKLYIPSYGSNENLIREKCSPGDNLHCLQGKWASEFLRNTFLSENIKDTNVADLKLYITRRNGSSRCFDNEQKIIELLENNGFTIVAPETLTIREQARMFSRASIVIAAHGAALTNTVFCKQGARIVEIHGAFTASCFWLVSNYMKLDHYTFLTWCSKKDIKKLHGQNYYSSLESHRLAPLKMTVAECQKLLEILLDSAGSKYSLAKKTA